MRQKPRNQDELDQEGSPKSVERAPEGRLTTYNKIKIDNYNSNIAKLRQINRICREKGRGRLRNHWYGELVVGLGLLAFGDALVHLVGKDLSPEDHYKNEYTFDLISDDISWEKRKARRQEEGREGGRGKYEGGNDRGEHEKPLEQRRHGQVSRQVDAVQV